MCAFSFLIVLYSAALSHTAFLIQAAGLEACQQDCTL